MVRTRPMPPDPAPLPDPGQARPPFLWHLLNALTLYVLTRAAFRYGYSTNHSSSGSVAKERAVDRTTMPATSSGDRP